MLKYDRIILIVLSLCAFCGIGYFHLRHAFPPPTFPKVATSADLRAAAQNLVSISKTNQAGTIWATMALTHSYGFFADYHTECSEVRMKWSDKFGDFAHGRWDPNLPWLNDGKDDFTTLRQAWKEIVLIIGPEQVADCLARALGPKGSFTAIVETSKYLSPHGGDPPAPGYFDNELPLLGVDFNTKVIKHLLKIRPATRANIIAWSQPQSRGCLRISLSQIDKLPMP